MMNSILRFTGLSFIFLLISSCFFSGVKGNGQVTIQERNISDDFIRIEASENIDVFITENGETKLTVEADENLHEFIKTEVENGTLFLSIKNNIWSAKRKAVHLSFERLNEIVVTSGAELTSDNTISADNLKVLAASRGEINLHLNVNHLHCEATSGSDINLDGKARIFSVNSKSGSDINAFGLTVQDCVAKASSGSDIKVHVEKSFEGKATSGADIRYKGEPDIIKEDNHTAGEIKDS